MYYDDDFWADHDENCHGTIDTEDMREEFPDGFQWSCCEQLGTEPGCKRGRHQADPSKSMKGSYISESEDGGDDDSDTDDDNGSEEDEDEEK